MVLIVGAVERRPLRAVAFDAIGQPLGLVRLAVRVREVVDLTIVDNGVDTGYGAW